MIKTSIIDMGNIAVSNATYSQEFFEKLYQKIDVTDQSERHTLKQIIKLATDAYLTHCGNHARELPSHKIKNKLAKSIENLDKAVECIKEIHTSAYYGEALTNNLFDVIHKKYPTLHNLLDEMIPYNHPSGMISPSRSLALLNAMKDGIEQTLENFESEKTPNKSDALYHWVITLATELEPIIGHKLEQSRYHNGQYISKRQVGDSELLLFIIEPLDPNVTLSQIETTIKNTRQKRHNFS